MEKKRYAYWDNIKGILIILVVFGHFLLGIQDFILNKIVICIIYMFHMPAFVFISGYFSKSEHSKSFNTIFKLTIAYILLTSGFMLGMMLCGKRTPSIITPYYSAWYLLALIVWRITVPYLSKVKHILIILTLISLFSVFWSEINLQYGMVKIIAFYPFFMAGYLLPKDKVKSILNIPQKKKYLFCGIFALSAIITGAILFYVFKIRLFDLIPNIYEQVDINRVFARASFFITSVFAIMFFMFLSVEKQLPFITKMGKNSLSIYILHRPITLSVAFILESSGLTTFGLIYCAIATFIFCFIAGSDFISKTVNNILEECCNLFNCDNNSKSIKNIIFRIIIIFAIVLILWIPYISEIKNKSNKLNLFQYKTMEKNMETEFDKAFKIIFAGDLILLEDQIKRGYHGGGGIPLKIILNIVRNIFLMRIWL